MNLSNVKISLLSLVPERARKEFERTWLSSLLGQAVVMLVLITAYVAALVSLYKLIPDVLDDLQPVVGGTVFYGIAVVPLGVILVFSTLPTAFRAWRQYRLSRRKFAWQAGVNELFRLHPYGADDQAEYKRPGGEDDKAANWIEATPHSVNYLCGPSGAGKSSLVQASLLPRLEVTGWRTAVVRVDADPVERIRLAVLSVPGLLLHGEEAETLPLADLLAAVSQRIGRTGQPPLLIVIDQFEEFLILNDATDHPLADILRVLADSPLKDIRLLLVFRSDYRELLFKLNLPRFRLMENAFELAPFRRDEAQGFLERGGLAMSRTGFDALFHGLDRIEELHGLYRPITLNMIGLVMKRTPDDQIKDPSRLIELYLRHCLAGGVSRDLVRSVLACMIMAEGTKEPRSIDELASLIRLEPWKIETTLCEMEITGLVRSISPNRDVWEISHDFLARQIGFLLGRLRQPRLQRYAAPALVIAMVSWAVTIAIAVFLVWPDVKEEEALNELAKLGFSRTAETGNHALILLDRNALTDTGFARFGRLIADLSDPVIEVRLRGTRITDLTPLKGLPLTQLDLSRADSITDLTPLKGLPLTQLDLRDADGITDLTPLKGMALTQLDLSFAGRITDLTPLKSLPLTQLNLNGTGRITDLTPLKGMALTQLDLSGAGRITDLTPLKGMPLTQLDLSGAGRITDLTPLKGMPLTQLDLSGADSITDLTPLKGMPLTQLDLSRADGITDLTPLKGLPLTQLDLSGADGITDLTPLKGMALTQLDLSFAGRITDLTPLKGMALTQLDLRRAGRITDLTPLKGMPLTQLDLSFADRITDLTPLKGMALTQLDLRRAGRITDLTPLKGMPLTQLDLSGADRITDLTPLKGMPLTQLDLSGADRITDLTPLKGMPLTQLDLSRADGITDLAPLQGMDPSIIRGASEELLATMN